MVAYSKSQKTKEKAEMKNPSESELITLSELRERAISPKRVVLGNFLSAVGERTLKGLWRFLMIRKWVDLLKCFETSRKDQNPIPKLSNFWNTFEKTVQTPSNSRFSLILMSFWKNIYNTWNDQIFVKM